MEGTHFWQVSTAVAERGQAEALALGSVAARLGACAQVSGPVTSTYWWQGELQSAQEWVVAIKTTAHSYPALEAYLRQAHPYQLPEVVAVPVVAGSPEYLAWVREVTADAEQ